jgi:probable rRNA maturation factor
VRKNNLEIKVFNSQRKHSLEVSLLEDFLYCLAAKMSVRLGFSVRLVNDGVMRRYNQQFAGKNVPTDVLSFPTTQDWAIEKPYAGDILISVETAERQSRGALMTELKGLALHGFLHLLGFDHEQDAGEMNKMESQLRKEFNLRQ